MADGARSSMFTAEDYIAALTSKEEPTLEDMAAESGYDLVVSGKAEYAQEINDKAGLVVYLGERAKEEGLALADRKEAANCTDSCKMFTPAVGYNYNTSKFEVRCSTCSDTCAHCKKVFYNVNDAMHLCRGSFLYSDRFEFGGCGGLLCDTCAECYTSGLCATLDNAKRVIFCRRELEKTQLAAAAEKLLVAERRSMTPAEKEAGLEQLQNEIDTQMMSSD